VKRNFILFILCLTIGITFTSCSSVSQDEYQAMLRELNQKKNLERQLSELQAAYESMQQNLKSEIEAQRVRIEKLSERVVKVTMPQDVLFPSASIVIDQPGRNMLGKVASSLRQAPDSSIRIIGHSDLLPITRADLKQRFTDNWELSAARSAAVARIFVWGEDINKERVHVIGRSHAEPVANNNTPEGRSKNRRIEIFVEQAVR
jgi:chemotaxis protein MotB